MTKCAGTRTGGQFGIRVVVAVVVLALVSACGSGNADVEGAQSSAADGDAAGGAGGDAVAGLGDGVFEREGPPPEVDADATFRYAWVQNPSSWDPHRAGNPWDVTHLRPVYDRLVHLTAELEPEPGLATSWEFVDDGDALVMELREDVTFHDGEAFNADAVASNLERAAFSDESVLASALRYIDSIEVEDDYTVRINLDGPGGNLPFLFADRAGMMVSPAALDNDDLDQNPVGTGMFHMVEYRPDDIIIYEPNEDYWDPDAIKIGRFEFHIQVSSATRLNMIRSGEVDATYVEPAQWQEARDAGLNTAESQSLSVMSVTFNANKEPFDDERVREAVSYAIDRQGLVEGLLFGFGEATAQPFPSDYWAYYPDVGPEYRPYDPDRARELLAEAGYEDGVQADFYVPHLNDHQQAGQAIQAMLAEVGIEAEITVIDSPTTVDRFYVREEGDFTPGMLATQPDPTQNLERHLPDSMFNLGNVSSPGFTDAYEAAIESGTVEERLPAIHEMIRLAVDDHTRHYIYVFKPPTVWTDDVVWPEDYRVAFSPDFRGIGIAAE